MVNLYHIIERSRYSGDYYPIKLFMFSAANNKYLSITRIVFGHTG